MRLKLFLICLPILMLIAVTDGAPQAGRGARGGNDPWPGKKKLLAIADVQTGFHHDSISQALATVDKLGRESGTYVTMIRTDTQLITKQQIAGQDPRYANRGVNARTLNFYDAIFLLPSGTGSLTDQQKAVRRPDVHV